MTQEKDNSKNRFDYEGLIKLDHLEIPCKDKQETLALIIVENKIYLN